MPFGHRAAVVAVVGMLLASAANARAQEPLPPASAQPAQPQPQAAPPPQEIEPDAEPRKGGRQVGLAGRIQGGLGQRALFDNSALGADLTGSLGLYVDNVNLYLDIQLFFGGTDGVPFRQYRFGPSIDFEPFSRVRLGAGLSIGGTSITRVTNGDSVSAFSIGGRLFGSVDVVKTGDRAGLYVFGQLSIDSAGELLGGDSRRSVGTTYVWGPTGGLGFRF